MGSMMSASLAIAAVAIAPLPAQADWIVNTGPGVLGVNTLLIDFDGRYQHLAASFSVQSDTTISSVEGWIGAAGDGQFEIQVFGAGSPIGSPLYTSLVVASDTPQAWQGASDLHWEVPVGTYTVAFIAQPGLNAWMPSRTANPLKDEWFITHVSSGWRSSATLDIGVRIAAVPEPASFVLLALGCLAVGGLAHSSGRVQPARANAA